MSIIRQQKKCLNCGRMYDFNPDVGKWRCPYCTPKTNKDGSFDFGRPVAVKEAEDGIQEKRN